MTFDLAALIKEYEDVHPEQKEKPWDKDVFCLVLHARVSGAYQAVISQSLERRTEYTTELAELGLAIVDYCVAHDIDLATHVLTGQERQTIPGRFEDGLLGLHERIQTIHDADVEPPGIVDLFAFLLLFGSALKLNLEKAMHKALQATKLKAKAKAAPEADPQGK